ncbi:hypothetical protein [Teredinibacter turnerae]|nr:hypothetical protein [Teredinibacter turnerae]
MTDNDAYREWNEMADCARKIAADPAIPQWQKAYKIAGAYQGLQLEKLRSKHRHKILQILTSMNQILALYKFETFEEYQHMEEKHLRDIIQMAKQLAPGK